MDTIVPDNLAELDGEALDALDKDLEAEFTALYDDDESSLEDLTAVRDAINGVRAQREVHEQEQAEKAEKRAALRDDVLGVEDTTDDEQEGGDGADAEAADDDGADDTVPEVVAEEVPAEEVEVVVEDDRELVAASARTAGRNAQRKPAPTRRRAASPAPAPAEASPVLITAAADVPGMSNGQTIDPVGVAKAMHARARGLGDSRGSRTPFPVATVTRPYDESLMIREATTDPWDVVDEAARSVLQGKDAAALVASGGWCAPSEPMYDLFSVESRDGLLDLPSVGVSRGGVMYPDYYGLEAVDSGLWNWTEANDETPGSDGDLTKPCIKIPCPTFSDCRLEAEGLCVTHGNLMDRAYPEQTRRFVDLVMTAHLHRLSNAMVSKILATANAVTVTSAPSDAAGDILNAVDLQVADYRSQHLMGANTVLDAIFPMWFIEAIRASLAMRNGVELTNVSNQQVIAHFTNRNTRPQFLAGYEPLFDTNPATAWPAGSKFVLMPAGGYVHASGGTLDLGVVRDSTLNETNDFTAAWSEEFYCVVKRGPAAREVTVTTAVDGQTGGLEFAGATTP